LPLSTINCKDQLQISIDTKANVNIRLAQNCFKESLLNII
jgi:hypothetical protein